MTTQIILTEPQRCAGFLKNVAILPLSCRRAFSTPKRSIASRHCKRRLRKKTRECHSPFVFTPTTLPSKKSSSRILNYFSTNPKFPLSSHNPNFTSYKRDKYTINFLFRSAPKTDHQPGTFQRACTRCKTCPFILNTDRISGPKRSIQITDPFSCSPANVIDCSTCTFCKKPYFAGTGRRLGDRFREHVLNAEKGDNDASKPEARHFNLPQDFTTHMAIYGLSLLNGVTKSRKSLEQRLIFQIGTPNSQGINERFSST